MWEALKNAAGYVLAVVPKPGKGRPPSIQLELVKKELRNAHEIIYHKAPFFPPSVYRHAILTIDKIDIRIAEGSICIARGETWTENKKNYDEMNDCFDALCSEIRKRIMGEDMSSEPVTPIKILDQIRSEIAEIIADGEPRNDEE